MGSNLLANCSQKTVQTGICWGKIELCPDTVASTIFCIDRVVDRDILGPTRSENVKLSSLFPPLTAQLGGFGEVFAKREWLELGEIKTIQTRDGKDAYILSLARPMEGSERTYDQMCHRPILQSPLIPLDQS